MEVAGSVLYNFPFFHKSKNEDNSRSISFIITYISDFCDENDVGAIGPKM